MSQPNKKPLLLRYYIDLFTKVNADQPPFLKSAIIENPLDDFLFIPSFLADKVLDQSIEIYQDMPELAVSSGFSLHKDHTNNFFIWLMASSGIIELLNRINTVCQENPFTVSYSDHRSITVTIPTIYINDELVMLFFLSFLTGLFSTVLPEAIFYVSVRFTKNVKNQFVESIPNAKVSFGSDYNQITISHPNTLYAPLETSNSILSDLLSDRSAIRDIVLKPDIIFNVQEIIKHSIHKTSLSISDVADELCVTPRTLQRRLKEKNESFQSLLNYERRSKALELMNDKTISRSRIVEMIGVQNLRSLYRIVGRP
ncbi:hypothetical protein A9Q81_00020 [Gammaproteobacteria bacterium 42_54_T18]|nr:hypothetical protein A9Q81_00020 [Gammaproteobacteria bacterium 42_54_T18]